MRNFEWDDAKAASNLLRHGVSFEEATTAFEDERAQFRYDSEHSFTEDRFMIMGLSNRGRLLAVWHSYRDPRIRIIGARLVTGTERNLYEEKHT